MKKLDEWMQAYSANLEKAVREYPKDYCYPIENVPLVAERMKGAFVRNSYNLDGHAIKRTCKHFGIKHTRKAIAAFLKGE